MSTIVQPLAFASSNPLSNRPIQAIAEQLEYRALANLYYDAAFS